jgi:hypothetical protein
VPGDDPPEASPPLGFPESVAVEQVAMLDDLIGIAMTAARTLGEKIEATGRAEPADVKSLATVMQAARRTMVLRNKLVADSRMTAAELAAAKARRDAGLARRDAARAASLLRSRKAAIGDALEELVKADAAERGTPPAATARLLQAVQERLLDADIDRAFGAADYSAIILGICKALGITPRQEVWSHRLMQLEIAATAATLRRFEDGLKDPGVRTPGVRTPGVRTPGVRTPGVRTPSMLPPTPAGLGNGPGPGGSYPKVGPFTFDATGAVASVDRPDDPPSTWKVPARWRLPDTG